ncbi:hypothetical protein LL912_08825 [Niabella sp. CC-SYL272]|uniref:hypothetical protein n=1 Tax=Niabella agricola TaxID=2891571 RepID=UPI001F235067|nr:hypothetical protein [Niabella agricola]MCF3108878.1 hypothetical protein [Niabella agricola]
MTAFRCKLQYKNYEPGEFTDMTPHTCEAVFELIRNFPWQQQREQLVVDFTTPSVTIQDDDGSYLKLALYYNGKYILYYYNAVHQLFVKSLTNPEDSFPFISAYYNNPGVPPDGLKREHTWHKAKRIHFVTNDFVYKAGKNRLRHYLIQSSGFNLVLSLMLVPLMIYIHPAGNATWMQLIIFLVLFFLVVGMNLLFIWNHYQTDKGKTLILSKGKPHFLFGTGNQLTLYKKQEIMSIDIWHIRRNSKSPLTDFACFTIYLADQTRLQFTSLLISEADFRAKMAGQHIIDVYILPWMSKADRTAL